MPTYTVHAPPPHHGETTSAPERFVFVRDGFHFWAFLLAPLWLLLHGLWLALVIYVVGYGVVGCRARRPARLGECAIPGWPADRLVDRVRSAEHLALDFGAARLDHARLRRR